MSPLEMIAEWRKGCSCAGPVNDRMLDRPAGSSRPEECHECTAALIDALEEALKLDEQQNIDAVSILRQATADGYLTPDFVYRGDETTCPIHGVRLSKHQSRSPGSRGIRVTSWCDQCRPEQGQIEK